MRSIRKLVVYVVCVAPTRSNLENMVKPGNPTIFIMCSQKLGNMRHRDPGDARKHAKTQNLDYRFTDVEQRAKRVAIRIGMPSPK